jgi:integrase/recombinase XerD
VSLGKQAKTLSKGQVEATMGWLTSTSIPDEKGVILLLSVRAGLRAKEIASLTWTMVTDADRQMSRTIHLPDKASKGRSGRANTDAQRPTIRSSGPVSRSKTQAG